MQRNMEGAGKPNDARGKSRRENSRIYTVHLYLSVVLVRKNEASPKHTSGTAIVDLAWTECVLYR